jgi:D-glycero-D-manno-heptose 1,7-bisphosphate phosphatase
MRRALFLDRDGVINKDYGYVHKIEEFHFREEIFEVCLAAQKACMKIIVITNQAGIGRGIYSISDFHALNSYMLNCFSRRNVDISGVYFCPFHPEHGIGQFKKISNDRKPSPGMIITACRDHQINPMHSIMIGDKESDKMAAYRAGIRIYVDASSPEWLLHSLNAIKA